MSDIEFESELDDCNVETNDDGENLNDVKIQDGTVDISEDEIVVDDEFYHANKLSEEELQAIDGMWDSDDIKSDVEPYHATKLADEELHKIDDLWAKNSESDIQPIDKMDSMAKEDIETIEDDFASKIESMSLDELIREREKIEKLSSIDDTDFFDAFDDINRKADDQTEMLIKNMTKSDLMDLKDLIEQRDPTTLKYFGIDVDDNSPKTLKRKLTKE